MHQGRDEEVRHISSIDLLRWVKFVEEREDEGLMKIDSALDWITLDSESNCTHQEDGKDFYPRLQKAVEDAFTFNPCVEGKDLFAVLDKVPDPPPGCKPPPHSDEFYYHACAVDEFRCPLRPMSIRSNLEEVARELATLNRTLLDEAFGEVVKSC